VWLSLLTSGCHQVQVGERSFIPVGYSTAIKLVEISRQRNADVVFENQENA
jgi:hypothetical protein